MSLAAEAVWLWLLLSFGVRLLITVTVGHASTYVAKQPFCLQITCPDVFSPPLDVHGGPSVPGIECISIVLAHLFFGGETVGELLEHQVRIYECDAATKTTSIHFIICATLSPGTQRRELVEVPAQSL